MNATTRKDFWSPASEWLAEFFATPFGIVLTYTAAFAILVYWKS